MAGSLRQAAVAIAALMLVTGGAAHAQSRDNRGREMMLSMGGGMKGKALKRAKGRATSAWIPRKSGARKYA
ncbi:hypothetical protein TPR58_12530 [Sphingomonas sp. HF-S3]|uniref:Uncharacterized protein n=1 Tax=Sphingomonas rustica TaxID=3103142 RepID=A0ABV0B8V0_9SPHN